MSQKFESGLYKKMNNQKGFYKKVFFVIKPQAGFIKVFFPDFYKEGDDPFFLFFQFIMKNRDFPFEKS